LSLVGVLARLEMKMSLSEVIAAYTYGAACALKLGSKKGSISPQMSADFICIEEDWTKLFFEIGSKIRIKTFRNGRGLN
jgi:imidazolonepropionase